MDARAAAASAKPAIDGMAVQRFRPDVPELAPLYEVHRWSTTYVVGRPAPLGGGPRLAHAVMGVLPFERVRLSFERVAAAQALEEFRTDYVAACERLGERCFGEQPDVAELADRLGSLVAGMELAGRPMTAAWLDAPLGDSAGAHVERWATALREFRGDAHQSVLAAAGMLGPEALIVAALWHGGKPEDLLAFFGWRDESEVEAAFDRLRDAGRLDPDGALTGAARKERDDIEAVTVDLAAEPWTQLTPDDRARTVELLEKAAAAL